MKKILVAFSVALLFLTLTNCGASRKAASDPVPKSTYVTDMKTLVLENCSPCHIPASGGKKKAYDNYENVKTDIDEILRRIQLNPGEKGFMPFKNEKLNDSTINAFRKWKEDGLLEQ
jgi:mono/diheme cytochrome c family protein